MGLPVKHRKNFVSHKKRWDKQTIVDEAALVKDYALKNKKEIRRIELSISKYKKIAKELNRDEDTKNSLQAKNFIEKLKLKGILNASAQSLDEVLDINIRDVLERRLSNVVYKMKLARTPKQARQFVVHRHVLVDGNVITAPSYLVSVPEEAKVEFREFSALSDENHPERKIEAHGLDEEQDELKTIPEKEKGPDFDKKEAILDDEEQDEVQE